MYPVQHISKKVLSALIQTCLESQFTKACVGFQSEWYKSEIAIGEPCKKAFVMKSTILLLSHSDNGAASHSKFDSHVCIY